MAASAASSSAMVDVDNDYVVQELDVIFHRGIDGQLHLMSYPLKPSYRPPELPSRVRMRPARTAFENEYQLESREEHFDEAARGDSRAAKIRMRSSEVTAKQLHMVGIVKSSRLYLTPLSSLQQLRPDMSHLDAPEAPKPVKDAGPNPVKLQTTFKRAPTSDRAEQMRKASYAYHSAQEEADPFISLLAHDEKSDMSKAVRAKIATAPAVDSNKRLGTGAGAGSGIDLEHGYDLDQALADATSGAGASSSSSSSSPAVVSATEYLRCASGTSDGGAQLSASASASAAAEAGNSGITAGAIGSVSLPVGATAATVAASAGNMSMTLSQLAKQPLPVQAEEVLRRANVLSFTRVLEFTSSAYSLNDVMEWLVKNARLVRGNWVLRSDLFYQPHWSVRDKKGHGAGGGGGRIGRVGGAAGRAASAHGTLRPAVLQRLVAARDYVLCAFAKSSLVDAEAVAEATKCRPRTVLEIMERVAVQEEAGGKWWRFKRPDDIDFEARYPDEARNQRRFWKRRDTELSHLFATSAEDDAVEVVGGDNDDGSGAAAASAMEQQEEKDEYMVAGGTGASVKGGSGRSRAGSVSKSKQDPALMVAVGGAGASASSSHAGAPAVVPAELLVAGGGDASSEPLGAPLPLIIKSEAGSAVAARMNKPARANLSSMIADTLGQRGVCSRAFILRKMRAQSDLEAVKSFYAAVAAQTGVSAASVEGSVNGAAAGVDGTGLSAALLPIALAGLDAIATETAALVPGRPNLIVLKSSGNAQVDRFRPVILRLLASRPSVKKNDIRSAVETTLGDADIPPAAYSRILKEIGVSSANNWSLKDGEEDRQITLDI